MNSVVMCWNDIIQKNNVQIRYLLQ
jgi:hypothetical protein